MTEASTVAVAPKNGLISRFFGAIVIGLTSIAFVISFSALIYAGPLSDFLGTAITLSMIGAAILVLLGTVLHRLPVVSQPQEVTALLIATGGAAIAAQVGMNAGPTVMAFVAMVTVTTAALVYIAGGLRVGNLARFMPFPVLGGFMAATGYLLLTGAIGLALDSHVGIWDLPNIMAVDQAIRWAPWVLLSTALAIAVRWTASDMVLPLGILLGTLGFYAIISVLGITMQQASADGLLLGPFPSGELGDPAKLLSQIDWTAAISQLPLVAGVTALTIVGTLLNMSGNEVSLKQTTDLDADLKAVGISNAVSGLAGAPVGYPMIGTTLLAFRFGLSGFFACVTAAGFYIACAIFGAEVLALLPRGIFASVIGFLGMDLLIRWLWDERRGVDNRDMAIILLIVLVAAFVGFLESIGVGFVVAAIIFVASYARLSPVHTRSTLSARSSVAERSDEDAARLMEEGEQVVILELCGYLFFGSAYGITDRVRAEIEDSSSEAIILDFARVSGLDISAIKSLWRISEMCREAGVRLTLSALPDEVVAVWEQPSVTLYATLDDAMVVEEDYVISQSVTAVVAASSEPSLQQVLAAWPSNLVEKIHIAAGEALFKEGDNSNTLYVLTDGYMRAEISRVGARALIVARYGAGALIGEIAYYGGSARTATVLGDTDATLLSVDPERLAEAGADAAHLHAAIARHFAKRLARTTRLVRQISV